jgi:hypothetical protein
MVRSRFMQAALVGAALISALVLGASTGGAQDTPDAPATGAAEADKYRNPLGEQPGGKPAAPARAAAKRKPDFREMLRRGASQDELWSALQRGGSAAHEDFMAAAKEHTDEQSEEIKRRSEAIQNDAKRRIDRAELELGGEMPSERLLRNVKDEFAAAGPWWLPPLGLFGGFVLVAIGYGVWTLTRERRYWALAIGGALSLGGVWWSVAAVRHALKDQYGHTVQSVAMVAALIAGAAVCFFTWKLLLQPSIRKLKPDVLVEGQKGVLAQCGRAADGSVWAGEVEGQSIYVTAEDRAVVIGPPGTGKTAFP